jgi:ferredoxin-NADP reductase
VPRGWQVATVSRLIEETARAKTIVLDVPGWAGHVAGQNVDVRLTAEDGDLAERSYAIASAPESAKVALTVERIDDGEVSSHLTGALRVSDELELRGPIGGPFTWRIDEGGPLLLVADGSGLVPLMAMLRHRAAKSSSHARSTRRVEGVRPAPRRGHAEGRWACPRTTSTDLRVA